MKKGELKRIVPGEWFTDKSPLHDAILTGKLLRFGNNITNIKFQQL